MFMEFACAGSACASMSTASPSQQISIEKGQPLAGMNPGGMSTRDANATSMMPAISVRLFRLRRLKRISQDSWRDEFYQQKRNGVSPRRVRAISPPIIAGLVAAAPINHLADAAIRSVFC
jgi:hypothetical protein